jgi:hypothetical protein
MFEALQQIVKTKPITIVAGNSVEGEFLRSGMQSVKKMLPNINIEIAARLPEDPLVYLQSKYHELSGTPDRLVFLEAADDFELPVNLARLVFVYRHPYPSTKEIRAIYLERGIEVTDYNVAQGRGMSQAELELVLNEAKYADDFWKYVDTARREKLELIGLEHEPPPAISDVAGLDDLMATLPKIRAGFSDRAIQAGLRFPKGFLIAGVPGTGKTLAARVIAAKLGLAMLSLGVDLVCDQGVRPLKKMLATAEMCSPCILYIDELDKFFSQASQKQVLGYLLKWLNDRTTPVFVIATLNRLDDIPPELIRAGRWNEIYSVTMPDANELIAQFRLHLGARDKQYLDDNFVSASEWRLLTDAAINCVGGEIAEIVDRVILDLVMEEAPFPLQIDFNRVLKEARGYKRQYARSASAILQMSNQIKDVCVPAGGANEILGDEQVDIY